MIEWTLFGIVVWVSIRRAVFGRWWRMCVGLLLVPAWGRGQVVNTPAVATGQITQIISADGIFAGAWGAGTSCGVGSCWSAADSVSYSSPTYTYTWNAGDYVPDVTLNPLHMAAGSVPVAYITAPAVPYTDAQGVLWYVMTYQLDKLSAGYAWSMPSSGTQTMGPGAGFTGLADTITCKLYFPGVLGSPCQVNGAGDVGLGGGGHDPAYLVNGSVFSTSTAEFAGSAQAGPVSLTNVPQQDFGEVYLGTGFLEVGLGAISVTSEAPGCYLSGTYPGGVSPAGATTAPTTVASPVTAESFPTTTEVYAATQAVSVSTYSAAQPNGISDPGPIENIIASSQLPLDQAVDSLAAGSPDLANRVAQVAIQSSVTWPARGAYSDPTTQPTPTFGGVDSFWAWSGDSGYVPVTDSSTGRVYDIPTQSVMFGTTSSSAVNPALAAMWKGSLSAVTALGPAWPILRYVVDFVVAIMCGYRIFLGWVRLGGVDDPHIPGLSALFGASTDSGRY